MEWPLGVLVLGHSSEFMELKSIVQNDKNYNLKQGNMALISRAYNEFQFLNFFSIRKFMLTAQRVNRFKW